MTDPNLLILETAEDGMIFENIHGPQASTEEIVSRSPGLPHFGLSEVSLIYGRPRGVTISIFELGVLTGQSRLIPGKKPDSSKGKNSRKN